MLSSGLLPYCTDESKFANNGVCIDSCGDKYTYEEKKSCHDECPEETYLSDAAKKICNACDESCETCEGKGNKACTSCPEDTYLENKECKDECTNYLYEDENTCYDTCPGGTYSVTNTKTCEKCHGDCATCNGSGASNCVTCGETKPYFHENTCLTECPGELEPNDEGVCAEASFGGYLFSGFAVLIALLTLF